MKYFKLVNDKVEGIQVEMPRNADGFFDKAWTFRIDFTSLDQAQRIAESASEFSGSRYLSVDNGNGSWPRFDVVEAPKVGDLVSQSFNGDSYPRGKIVKISPTFKKVTTDTGHEFYRLKHTGSWLINGYAAMIPGHHSEMNPSF